jgi:hypothetical protein
MSPPTNNRRSGKYKRRYIIQCSRRVSEITFPRYMYVRSQNIGKPNNLKVLERKNNKNNTKTTKVINSLKVYCST